MPTNFYMFFVAALIPLLIGAVYYHPKVAGTAWMKSNGFTEESLAGANMPLILGLAYFFSLLFSVAVSGLVIHQSGVFQMMAPDLQVAGSEAMNDFNSMMAKYGSNHRSFAHGAIHGVFAAIFIALPLIGINALFERRGAKYIFIHLGYWVITMVLMGGLLCQTLQYAPLS